MMEIGNIARHFDGDKRNGSVTWSTVVGVTRPLRAVCLRGDKSEVPTADATRPPRVCEAT